jgi:glycosyltransferase involved in cell wall biosynthesis
MNICQIGTGLIPINPKNQRAGAIEKVIFNLSYNLAQLENEVYIYDIRDSSRENLGPGIHVKEINQIFKSSDLMKTMYFSLSSKVQKGFFDKKMGFNVIHAHLGITSILHSIPKNVPIVFTPHNKKWFIESTKWDIQDIIQIKSDVMAIKNASAVIALNENAKQIFVKSSSVSEDKVHIIPNGVNSDLFYPNKYDIDDNTDFSILCIGRIEPLKNQLVILKALSLIKNDNPNIMATFIGPIEDYDYYNNMISFAKKHDIYESIKFLRNIPIEEVIRQINLSTIFVFPSLTEVFSLALLEAMSCGKAIIASSIPQNREILQSGNEFIIVPPSDINAFSKEILKLLDDSKLREKLGENSRKTVIDYFDWNIIANRTLNVYKDILIK